MKKTSGLVFLFIVLSPLVALGHHGGVSLPFGPGAPIETSAPLTLPEGGVVLYSRIEEVEWRKFQFAEPHNKSSFTFTSIGVH